MILYPRPFGSRVIATPGYYSFIFTHLSITHLSITPGYFHSFIHYSRIFLIYFHSRIFSLIYPLLILSSNSVQCVRRKGPAYLPSVHSPTKLKQENVKQIYKYLLSSVGQRLDFILVLSVVLSVVLSALSTMSVSPPQRGGASETIAKLSFPPCGTPPRPFGSRVMFFRAHVQESNSNPSSRLKLVAPAVGVVNNTSSICSSQWSPRLTKLLNRQVARAGASAPDNSSSCLILLSPAASTTPRGRPSSLAVHRCRSFSLIAGSPTTETVASNTLFSNELSAQRASCCMFAYKAVVLVQTTEHVYISTHKPPVGTNHRTKKNCVVGSCLWYLCTSTHGLVQNIRTGGCHILVWQPASDKHGHVSERRLPTDKGRMYRFGSGSHRKARCIRALP